MFVKERGAWAPNEETGRVRAHAAERSAGCGAGAAIHDACASSRLEWGNAALPLKEVLLGINTIQFTLTERYKFRRAIIPAFSNVVFFEPVT